MAITETIWCATDKLYASSGQFTSTIRTSLAPSQAAQDISWDGVSTPWVSNVTTKLYLQSGKFSSTIKTSLNVFSFNGVPDGIDLDVNKNTPWCGIAAPTSLFLQSGQFSSTLKTSQDISGIETKIHSISFDGINTFFAGYGPGKLYRISGQFSTTVKASLSVTSNDLYGGIHDGTNTPYTGQGPEKLYLQSGYFTSTIKTSLSVAAASNVRGIDVDDYQARQGVDPNHNPNPGSGGGIATSRGRILTARDDRKLREKVEAELSEVEEIKIDTAAMSRVLDIIFREVDQEKEVEKARQEERITQIIRETISFEHKQRGVKEQLEAIEQLRRDVAKGNKDLEALIALLLARLL